MGMSASQARLLSITARLTSNEYESQQISNAKMRLSTQTQEASEAYINALNSSQYNFVTYNSAGESTKTPLTAAVLYEYGDNKNQYIITNSAGKALVSNQDYQNYKNSANLDEFLKCYGVDKEFKTDTLKSTYEYCMEGDGVKAKNDWENALEALSQTAEHDKEVSWPNKKLESQLKYMNALSDYNIAVQKKQAGKDISDATINELLKTMEIAKQEFTKKVSYRSFLESELIDSNTDAKTGEQTDLLKNYNEYQSQYSQYKDELDRLGISADKAYVYKDQTKAQWYTNLWYKINGESTDNTQLNNCAVLNPASNSEDVQTDIYNDLTKVRNLKSMDSTNWIADALAKGYINLEMASYNGESKVQQDSNDPFKFNLQGISWNSKIYSSCPDIVSSDNDKAVSKAEAEYEQKTAEINAKDERYQRKLSLLDSEHNAIQQEYESVKGAMDKNIDRSFKAFQG